MPARLRGLLRLCLVLSLLLMGCASERAIPELIALTELAPDSVGAGDVVEVRGVGLPVGDVGSARVVFAGDLHRPGEPALRGRRIEVEDARLERDRVTFELTDELLDRFTGHGDEALHTTFRGTVEVWLPGAASSLPVHGVLKGTTVLEIEPRAPRRPVLEERERSAREAHAFLGLDLAGADRGGMTVASVRPGSPGARAGLEKDDIIVIFSGVTVLSPADAVPSGREERVSATIVRGEERRDVTFDVSGFRGTTSRDLVDAAAVAGALLAFLLLLGSRAASFVTWLVHRLERAASARSAQGGLVVGLVRQATRAEGTTARSTLAAVAPILVFTGATLTFAILPYFELRGLREADLTLLYLVSLTSFATMGLVTGGWSERGPGLWGHLRAMAGVLICELPAACALGAVVVASGSVRASDIAASQVGSRGTLLETGGWPWYWNAVKSPLLFALFACFFLAVLVDGGPTRDKGDKATFSLRRGAFSFAEWTNVLVMCAIGAVAFLGGWYVPGFSVHEHAQDGRLIALAIALFLAKCWLLALTVLALRAALPRLSVMALMKAGYRALLPLAVVALGLAALLARYPLLPVAERALSVATLATSTAIGILFLVTGRAKKAELGSGSRTFSRVNTMI
ncbi:MAG: hypothetical protein HOV80_15910 [Polyangiaceae bacterium]|nr:hypothetical protein [Polyangiaceae bacterium]